MESFEIGDRVYSKFAWNVENKGEAEVVDVTEYAIKVRYDNENFTVWENKSDMRKVK